MFRAWGIAGIEPTQSKSGCDSSWTQPSPFPTALRGPSSPKQNNGGFSLQRNTRWVGETLVPPFQCIWLDCISQISQSNMFRLFEMGMNRQGKIHARWSLCMVRTRSQNSKKEKTSLNARRKMLNIDTNNLNFFFLVAFKSFFLWICIVQMLKLNRLCPLPKIYWTRRRKLVDKLFLRVYAFCNFFVCLVMCVPQSKKDQEHERWIQDYHFVFSQRRRPCLHLHYLCSLPPQHYRISFWHSNNTSTDSTHHHSNKPPPQLTATVTPYRHLHSPQQHRLLSLIATSWFSESIFLTPCCGLVAPSFSLTCTLILGCRNEASLYL